ncbi:hypothetical protein [Pseudomonas sp. MWU13-3659]|uniref:hypothetical protein n=1 Tax=Pseudomonas sp. MWU13-3659 TaxID=2986964 RepID=UPI002075C8C4|nr:hypothetical protein [Pseudomonas sp. MWU13-3659]
MPFSLTINDRSCFPINSTIDHKDLAAIRNTAPDAEIKIKGILQRIIDWFNNVDRGKVENLLREIVNAKHLTTARRAYETLKNLAPEHQRDKFIISTEKCKKGDDATEKNYTTFKIGDEVLSYFAPASKTLSKDSSVEMDPDLSFPIDNNIKKTEPYITALVNHEDAKLAVSDLNIDQSLKDDPAGALKKLENYQTEKSNLQSAATAAQNKIGKFLSENNYTSTEQELNELTEELNSLDAHIATITAQYKDAKTPNSSNDVLDYGPALELSKRHREKLLTKIEPYEKLKAEHDELYKTKIDAENALTTHTKNALESLDKEKTTILNNFITTQKSLLPGDVIIKLVNDTMAPNLKERNAISTTISTNIDAAEKDGRRITFDLHFADKADGNTGTHVQFCVVLDAEKKLSVATDLHHVKLVPHDNFRNYLGHYS